MRRTLLAATLALAPALAAIGCSDASGAADDGKLHVVATTTVTADFAREVGGSLVTVYDIVKPGVDPHDFEPSPADLDALGRADVVVKNGVGLEPWLDETLDSAGGNATVVDTSTGVALKGDDPHIWHDPTNAVRMVTTIADAFAAADPDNAATYSKWSSLYIDRLRELNGEIAARIATLDNKKVVTNHDAFRYYLDHFGLEFVGSIIPSFDTSAELSAGEINDLIAKIKAEGVTAIFSESTLPPKTAKTIAEEAGIKVVEGEDALYGDSLGPSGSAGDTYLEMERHNTDVIVTALGGDGGDT